VLVLDLKALTSRADGPAPAEGRQEERQ